jgi:hypothetical protein
VATSSAESVIAHVNTDILEAQDNLLESKIFQEHYANSNHGLEFVYKVGDNVMLLTFHHHCEFHKKGKQCSAKFFPHWDGPYKVTKAHAESSSYTLDLLPGHNNFPTFYASELKLHMLNDASLFPSRAHSQPGPILTPDGLHEHKIDGILDAQPCGCGYQFLIRWKGYGPEDDKWLPTSLLQDCEVLDVWYDSGGDGPGNAQYLSPGF